MTTESLTPSRVFSSEKEQFFFLSLDKSIIIKFVFSDSLKSTALVRVNYVAGIHIRAHLSGIKT